MFMGPFRSRLGDWRTSGVVAIAALAIIFGGFLNHWLYPRHVENPIFVWADSFQPSLGESYHVQTCRLVEVFNNQLAGKGELGVVVELNLPQSVDPLMRWYPRLVYPRNEVIWVDQLSANTAVFVRAGDGTIKLLLSAPQPDTRQPDRTFATFCALNTTSLHFDYGSE